MYETDDLNEPTSWAPEGIGYRSADNLESEIQQELLTEYGQQLVNEMEAETDPHP
jgi:hypothetical protein